MLVLKTEDDISILRENGRFLAEVMDVMEHSVCAGISTKDLDNIAYDEIIKKKAKPSFLNYSGFPASICASINEEIVHGIPSVKRVLNDGDIISIDLGLYKNGFHVDMAKTFAIGTVDEKSKSLIDVTRDSLDRGISQCTKGKTLGDIGFAIQNYVEANAFSVVREYVGHGVGRNLHEAPQVPNFGLPNSGQKLRVGMVIAIEPMVNVGTWKTKVLGDNWTVITLDGKRSAHFEHTVAITENGTEVLTRI